MLDELLARVRRRAEIRRAAGHLVTRHGLAAAIAIARVQYAEGERALFEKLAMVCDQQLHCAASGSRRDIAARWAR